MKQARKACFESFVVTVFTLVFKPKVKAAHLHALKQAEGSPRHREPHSDFWKEITQRGHNTCPSSVFDRGDVGWWALQ